MEPESTGIEGRENNAGAQANMSIPKPSPVRRGLPVDSYDGVYYATELHERRGNRAPQEIIPKADATLKPRNPGYVLEYSMRIS
jgi:hypothetical protein